MPFAAATPNAKAALNLCLAAAIAIYREKEGLTHAQLQNLPTSNQLQQYRGSVITRSASA